jgi:hypothetical protein
MTAPSQAFPAQAFPVVYRVDPENVIVFVNDAFRAFAVRNDGAPLVDCVGQSLWTHIRDWDTRQIYGILFDRVRSTGQLARIPFRCDSPDCRRFMEMEIENVAGGQLELRCHLDREERRPSVPIHQLQPDDLHRRMAPHQLITMCSWCLRIRNSSLDWLEVEDALSDMRVFVSDLPTAITHGICKPCFTKMISSWS